MTRAVADDLVLKQAFVDRPKLLHAQVAVVDVAAAVGVCSKDRASITRAMTRVGQIEPW